MVIWSLEWGRDPEQKSGVKKFIEVLLNVPRFAYECFKQKRKDAIAFNVIVLITTQNMERNLRMLHHHHC